MMIASSGLPTPDWMCRSNRAENGTAVASWPSGESIFAQRLFCAAWGAKMHDDDFKKYYEYLREQGRSYVESMVIISRKLVRIMFCLAKIIQFTIRLCLICLRQINSLIRLQPLTFPFNGHPEPLARDLLPLLCHPAPLARDLFRIIKNTTSAPKSLTILTT